jgi:ABC-type transporter Mla subunit MlaD
MENWQDLGVEEKKGAPGKTAEELLQEMLINQKKNSKITKVASFSVIFGVIILTASLIMIIPRTLQFINHAESSLSEVDKLMAESEAAFTEINSAANEANDLLTQANDVIMPQTTAFISHAEASLTQIDQVIADADKAMEEINKATVKMDTVMDQASVLIENSNAMVENNTEAITETIQKLNKVDFEALNKAIKDLSAVIEPLAKFFGAFR